MEWTPDLSVGVEKIDEQHRELFRRIGDLVSAIKSKTCKLTIGDTMKFLEEYIVTHFSEEEGIMNETGYPQFDAHRAQHVKFMQDFEHFKQEMAGESSSYTKSVLANQMVVDWILDHIKKVDFAFGRYMKERQG